MRIDGSWRGDGEGAVEPDGTERPAGYFFDSTEEKRHMARETDIVLIHYEDQPLVFARIEDIAPDNKPGWYHVKLLMLQVPLQTVSWILRDSYIDGAEFTMGGKRVRLEPVVAPPETPDGEPRGGAPDKSTGTPKKATTASKVISLADKKKKPVR
jgi:hypothetical protein